MGEEKLEHRDQTATGTLFDTRSEQGDRDVEACLVVSSRQASEIRGEKRARIQQREPPPGSIDWKRRLDKLDGGGVTVVIPI